MFAPKDLSKYYSFKYSPDLEVKCRSGFGHSAISIFIFQECQNKVQDTSHSPFKNVEKWSCRVLFLVLNKSLTLAYCLFNSESSGVRHPIWFWRTVMLCFCWRICCLISWNQNKPPALHPNTGSLHSSWALHYLCVCVYMYVLVDACVQVYMGVRRQPWLFCILL